MLKLKSQQPTGAARGQTLVELALTFPLFMMVLMGIIVLGLGLFYDQQVKNAAREGARFAAVHSATSRCPTVSNLTPDVALLPLPNSYSPCDPPDQRWPYMTAAARSRLVGLPTGQVQVTACWSGYWTKDTSGAWAAHDEVAINADGTRNDFRDCTVRLYGWCSGSTGASTLHVINPKTLLDPACPATNKSVRVDCSRQFPLTTQADDMASSYAKSDGRNANQVTVLTCYPWSPPLSGFLLIPTTVDLVAVVTETLEYQQ